MIGIYKITSPTNKVYIGQSVDIKRRFKSYDSLEKSGKQKILCNSFKKHGKKNHVFEIICECDISELDIKERYYQELFNSVGANGLNCFKTSLDIENTYLKISKRNKKKQIIKKAKIELKLKEIEDKKKRKQVISVIDSIIFNP